MKAKPSDLMMGDKAYGLRTKADTAGGDRIRGERTKGERINGAIKLGTENRKYHKCGWKLTQDEGRQGERGEDDGGKGDR